MLIGFIHGVMNTDNMALSGEGIDYGPCAVLDEHRRGAVFSSIDRGGRYAYGNQPGIAQWNLSRFAETLLPLMDEEDPNRAVERATGVLEHFEGWYLEAYGRGLAQKLGIPLEVGDTERLAAVLELGGELFGMLEEQRVDHTGFFRALEEGEAAMLPTGSEAFAGWSERWEALRGPGAPAGVNPLYVPRNAHLDAALRAAHLGDLDPVHELLEAVRAPFTRREGLEHLEGAGDAGEGFLTFCGT